MNIFILGGGGHAKVIIDLLRDCGFQDELILLDDSPNMQNCIVNGVRVQGRIEDLPADFSESAIIALGANNIRMNIDRKFKDAKWLTLLHPSAIISPSAKLDVGSVVMAGAVLQCEAKCGRHVIINTKASIDHETEIGDYCHIAPGCALAGNVRVGQQSFIGIGASVIQGITIGENTTIGAGSCVVKNIPANAIAVGVPTTIINIKSEIL